ncbi:hypothetical protein N8Z60_00350 [Gammaproteobacteria bacterium]|nr:hypothetical protein [Gammaproteobacteria bacterium]
MNRILAFDSMHIVNPIRKAYMIMVGRLLNAQETTTSRLVLYRLDQDNLLIRDKRNLSGMAIRAHKDHIDAMSIKFYQYLNKSGSCDGLQIKNLQLYKLYTRQVKLKLTGVLKCAYRIRNLSNDSEANIEIITDRQTFSILQEAFLFLNYKPTKITWKVNGLLTSCITINSLIMRFAALIKMLISPSDLPKDYFYKRVDSNSPTVLITMPRRRTEDFFSTYVKEFSNEFNTVLYSMGPWHNAPLDYKRIKIERTRGVLQGIFNRNNMCFSADSYIADILLIFYDHANLLSSIDIVNSIFANKIDAHVSRQQTNVLDNYLAIEARKRGVFILGDIMEEIFYCDSAIFSSKSENTEPSRLALASHSKVTYKGSNSLINYRLKNFNENQFHYLHKLLKVDTQKKIIFYASDPSKDESQRYLTEKFLIDCFSRMKDFILVIKTHPQDNGKITSYAYLDSAKPSNVTLIGDETQRNKIISNQFNIFNDFNFNTAVSSSDGFLTFSSSSILQALMLGVKTGVVDKFNNGNYDYLVNHKASMLINSEENLQTFLKRETSDVSDEILSFCGLKNENDKFDAVEYLIKGLREFDKSYEKKA